MMITITTSGMPAAICVASSVTGFTAGSRVIAAH